MAQILDGKALRDKIIEDLKKEISRLHAQPKLVIVQVGSLDESNAYIAQKIKFGQKIGAIVDHIKLPANINQKDLISKVLAPNSDPNIHGIIVQLPIPQHLEDDEIVESIAPQKDVDGQTSKSLKLLIENQPTFIPATTRGILTLLDHYKISIEGKHVVVIGRSTLVGKPTALAFLNRDATVTICHRKTKNLAQITKTADILVVAVGKINLITKDHVNPKQIIIDVGINVIEKENSQDKPESEPSGRTLTGDVDFEKVSKVVKAISPVPGGTGPMTVASLFQNLLQAYKRQSR